MNALLVSTYDLGRQPFGLASPAAWLAREGVAVRALDLAVETLDEAAVRAADLVAFHLPMHTATRLAGVMIPRVLALNPRAHLCAYGLYAPMNEAWLRALGVHSVIGGEFEAALAALARALVAERGEPPAGAEGAPPAPAPGVARAHVAFDRLEFLPPRRDGLPGLERYARLRVNGEERLVGATEASRGCRHRCRHCPIPPVYGGRFRIVPREIVLEDVRRQVRAGARHITFGDPDFFNGIGHALPLVEALHAEHPDLTYDVTIKIEHLRRDRDRLPVLRRTGCAFVTSAVEAVDDAVLERLAKGHSRADFEAVAADFRALGLVLQPTFVAFTPWTTLAGYRALLRAIAALDLVEHVAPVQLAIRLLLPHGSLLMELDEVRAFAGPFDDAALVHPWRHPDPCVDALQERLAGMIAERTARDEGRSAIFEHAWTLAGLPASEAPRALEPAGVAARRAPVPYLTEPWYC
ncbi:MAG TPA: CUAEP/CCAEP-tail radical SAM protein [Candidatus Eisenbacteria bacterium]